MDKNPNAHAHAHAHAYMHKQLKWLQGFSVKSVTIRSAWGCRVHVESGHTTAASM